MHFLGCPVAGSTADVFDYPCLKYAQLNPGGKKFS